VQGEFTGSTLVYMNNGVIRHVDVGKINLTYIYDAAVTGSIGSWARFNIAGSVNIGEANVFIIDKNDVLTGGQAFVATFPASLERSSSVGHFNVTILKADRATVSGAIFQGKNLIQPLMTLGGGYIQANSGPNLREITNTIPTNGIYVNTEPTLGTWKLGQIVWRSATSAGGSPGYVCITGGTPGTWKAMANVAP
jgi:hypothetical protein